MTNPGTPIPYHDLAENGPLALLEREEDRARALFEAGRRQFTGFLIDVLDIASRFWARRARGPYLAELEALNRWPLPRGAWFMNHAYEWGCTTSVMADPAGGPRMLRTLDWPFNGLGRNLAVARHETPVGPYYNVTWPGFLGVITAMAPGRFAIAINQAPVRKFGPRWLPYPWVLDWVVARFRTFSRRRPVPAQVLRQVFEQCRSFDEAVDRLRNTPLALPVFFVIAGVGTGEAIAIERLEDEAFLYDESAAMANHWLNPDLAGKSRGKESRARRERLIAHQLSDEWSFDWLSPPILNHETRLAVMANALSGSLWVQGFESDGPATEILRIEHGVAL